jgi:hypothetical protein
MNNMTARAAVAEGLDDYSDSLWDAIETSLIAVVASQEPAWMREARREMAEYDGFDWAYEDWKLERDWIAAEAEYDDAMLRMDDDGGPVTQDWWSYDWRI